MTRNRSAGIFLVSALLVSACSQPLPAGPAHTSERPAASITLSIALDGTQATANAKELLARRDVTTVEVPNDVSYHRLARYRAFPVADLLAASTTKGASTLQAKAADGFAAEIPVSLLTRRDGTSPTAYLAIEDPTSPWPALPGKQTTAGPFYLIWAGPHSNQISTEYWPYKIVSLTLKADPSVRWSALSAERVVDAGAHARSGQRLFAANCLSCHQLDGEGDGKIGPDLDKPMNPTAYFQGAALHRYIRDPASVRHWPGQQMPAFGPDRLSDAEIDDLIAYLSAVRKHPPS